LKILGETYPLEKLKSKKGFIPEGGRLERKGHAFVSKRYCAGKPTQKKGVNMGKKIKLRKKRRVAKGNDGTGSVRE